MDKRYQRTQRALTKAMLDLIGEKAWDDITIELIVNRADIARKTFYAHYENKQQLLWVSLLSHFQEIEETMGELNSDTLLTDSKPLTYAVFKHVSEFQVFYCSMLLESADKTFSNQLMDYLSAASYQRHAPLRESAPFMTVPPELISSTLSGALIGALRWWLRSDMGVSPEEMAYQFSQLVAPGVLQSMGLDEEH